MVVSEKWTGTNIDRRDMERLRLEQVLRRNFGRLAMFGFSSTLMCSWEAIIVSLAFSLANGGTAALFWNYIIVAIGFVPVYASIAELGSAIPTSGGQYYWVSVLAPKSCHRYLSYVTGWLCTLAWQSGITSSSFLSGTIVQALFVLNIDSYESKPWHGTLLTIAIVTIAIIFNTLLARKLPVVEGLLILIHLLGIAIFIPIWVLAPRRTGGSPLTEFYNPNGWSSTGVADLVSILYPVTALLGFDCSVHMVEETKDSSLTMPLSMLFGFGINSVLGFFAVMTTIYTIGPLDTALHSASGYPFVEWFFNSTQSRAATTVMASVIIINFGASVIAAVATSSRQLWAFARSKGVPFPHWLAPGALKYDLPLGALAFSFGLTAFLSLINLGSTVVLNALLSLGLGALTTSYIITISCAIYHRLQHKPLPPARYSLGKYGLAINMIAVLFLLPVNVFLFFPIVPLPLLNLTNMNWGVLMYGGTILLASIYYVIWGKHSFISPRENITEVAQAMDHGYNEPETKTAAHEIKYEHE